MNSELALHPTAALLTSVEVTVGAPLCELMRRYSDANEEPAHAFEWSGNPRWESDHELGGEAGEFAGIGYSRHVDLQLAVA